MCTGIHRQHIESYWNRINMSCHGQELPVYFNEFIWHEHDQIFSRHHNYILYKPRRLVVKIMYNVTFIIIIHIYISTHSYGWKTFAIFCIYKHKESGPRSEPPSKGTTSIVVEYTPPALEPPPFN